MKQDEIIEMARQADKGFDGGPDADGTMEDSIVGIDAVIRFAKLVAAKEREACAKVCDAKDEIWAKAGLWNPVGEYKECAAAIRARSISRGEA